MFSRSAALGLALAALSLPVRPACAQGTKPPPRAPGAPAAVAQAQFDITKSTIPWFPLGASPIALRGEVRPGMFLSAVGRRAIAMGTEDGALELWTWPIKWLHDFRLSFRVPKYTQPIDGRDVAQSMEERPEGVTVTYAYEQFTVKEHVFVPLDKPAVVILLEVDAIRPLDIIAQFTPDIHYAWPAGLGGQYLIWEQNARAFLFSEGKRSINAFLGSPAVTQASDVPAHMLAAAPPQLVLGVGSDSDRYTAPRLGEPPGHNVNIHEAYIPIVLAGGEMPHDSALAMYRELIAPGAAEREWKRRVAHEDSIRTTMFALHSPDTLLNKAVEYAKVNLDEGYVCNPDVGCGMVAGYGLSGGASDRPGFGWFFGGDAAINSFAMDGAGETQHVRQGVLRFFAKYQRTDGKITHEISQGAGHVDWFDYPYPYYHGDTTPFWVLAFGEYWRQTADTSLVKELWPNIQKAYEWSKATDSNGDGLMETPAAGAGALEVGDLQIGILSDVYMNGVWIASLDRFAQMARALGRGALADSALAIRAKALHTMESKFWLPKLGQYGFALLQDGSVNENLTAWAATAMGFRVFDPTHGAEMAAKLASSDIMTDWGARPLSATSTLFDPLHYNNGAVWPFVTGWVSLAAYNYHDAPAGWFALDAIARTTFDQSRGRNPEVISGRLYKPLDTAVPQQFFATSMVLTPLVRGLLGIDVNAPAHRVTIAPHLPPQWDSVAVDNVPVGSDRLSFTIRRMEGAMTLDVRRAGSDAAPIDVVFSPALPLGARVADGVTTEATPGDVHATVRGALRESASLRVAYTGGWSIVPPSMPAVIGERSHAPRVLSERLGAARRDAPPGSGRYEVSLQGLADSTYEFEVMAPDAGSAGRLSAAASAGSVSLLPWRAGRARRLRITFPASGANADGYTAATLVVDGAGRP
ncbi:MAG TPA: GH116 family glycosyl hydrolase [Gemmatimonadaceae bacterium]|nr:GH116 family glycosyl hydrolase [Gemmatimonadaceae bacterium]